MTYEQSANELTNRILLLIKADPKVADIDNPFHLFKAGLQCSDIGPTLAQAQAALSKAKSIYRSSPAQEK